MREAYSEIVSALDLFFDEFLRRRYRETKTNLSPELPSFQCRRRPNGRRCYAGRLRSLENRLSPKDRNQPRYDQIISIDISGPEAALAKVQIAYDDQFFTDYLSLLKIDGRWQIITKTFTYVLLEIATARLAAE